MYKHKGQIYTYTHTVYEYKPKMEQYQINDQNNIG